jgi:hypothetical protein
MIAGWKSTWETNGIKWIFAVKTLSSHLSSSAQADTYVTGKGIDFGYRTNDADNSAGAFTVVDSSNFAAVPWTGVVRLSTMELVCDEPDTNYLDLQSIAAALSANPDADLSAYCTAH